MDPIVCTYVIEDTHFSESEGLSLAGTMRASWVIEQKSDPLYGSWLDSGYRKHFRRAKTAAFEKLIEEIPGMVLSSPHTRLWASPLMGTEELPKLIKRLQMSNFTLTPNIAVTELAPVGVVVNSELSMSFGKAAAGAAHAAQNLAIELERSYPALLDIWAKAHFATTASSGELIERDSISASVQDLGLTQVPAGSITAQAFILSERM